MRHLLLATITLGLCACSAPGAETITGEPPDENPLANAEVPAEEQVQSPDGVVLDDGRVISEEEAHTGLVPKANLFFIKRMIGNPNVRVTGSLPATLTSHVCSLGMVWGTLYGTGSQALVTTDASTWSMTTFPLGNPGRIAMEALCYQLNAFSSSQPGGTLLGPSSEFAAKIFATGSAAADTWKGDAATFMTGIGGRFSGTGEVARVVQNQMPDLLSRIQINSLQNDSHMIWGRSLFVGRSGGIHVPQFIGPNGDSTGSISEVGEWTHEFDAGASFNVARTHMASVTEAFCYLTKVTGHWGNGDSFVQIWPVDGIWTLRTYATGSNHIYASAACYKLRQ